MREASRYDGGALGVRKLVKSVFISILNFAVCCGDMCPYIKCSLIKVQLI